MNDTNEMYDVYLIWITRQERRCLVAKIRIDIFTLYFCRHYIQNGAWYGAGMASSIKFSSSL